jgi:hypothetical protein
MFKQVGLRLKEDRLYEIQSRSLDGCSRLGLPDDLGEVGRGAFEHRPALN